MKRIEQISTNNLVIRELFVIWKDFQISRFETFKKFFPLLPNLIVNGKNEIIFGLDNYYGIKKQNNPDYLEVLKLQINDDEALILGFNLCSKIFSISIYEKLKFLQKALNFFSAQEIYQKVEGINVRINSQLVSSLKILLSTKKWIKLLIKL